ncbi:MAG: hypothetical protein H6832_17310 [Planctomycetes bacterium]|nr:hypothetical protein [Planctomycetota bacterium]MCB9920163.1 hypothetical protein [Planctomycetota bacterium]
MRRALCPVLVYSVFAAVASAQNIVTNGDFGGATIAPWTVSGYAINPGLTRDDVDGTGVSQCYAARPGYQTAPPASPFVLQQPVTLVPLDYELTLDVAHVGSLLSPSLAMGRIQVFVGNQQVASFQFTATRQPRVLQRRRLCAIFKPPTTGSSTLRVELFYTSKATTTSPQLLVDNVDVRLARNPMFCVTGERALGQTVSLDLVGSPSAVFVVLLSNSELPQPISIPGFKGQLGLGLQVLLPVLSGALDTSGAFQQSLLVPNVAGIAGVPLYWQALEVTTSAKSLGWHSQQAFYQ